MLTSWISSLFTNSHSFPDIILTPSNSYSWCIITVVNVASCWCLECPRDWIQLAELTVPVCMSNPLPRIWTIISFHYLTKLLTLLLLFLAKDKQSFLICVSSGFKHSVLLHWKISLGHSSLTECWCMKEVLERTYVDFKLNYLKGDFWHCLFGQIYRLVHNVCTRVDGLIRHLSNYACFIIKNFMFFNCLNMSLKLRYFCGESSMVFMYIAFSL